MYMLSLSVLSVVLLGLRAEQHGQQRQNEQPAIAANVYTTANVVPPCGVVRIDGNKGSLEDYINGIYRNDPREPLVNGRLSLQKDREPDDMTDMFLMFRSGRWFITFFAPGQGKKMTALGFFESDVEDPADIDVGLTVAGAIDTGVVVTCIAPSHIPRHLVDGSCDAASGACEEADVNVEPNKARPV